MDEHSTNDHPLRGQSVRTSPAGFSICVPCVRAGTIQRAIESIRDQRRADWEVIIIAQGTDPGLRRRLDDISTCDDRVRVVWLSELGVSRARNLGATLGRYDTIVFLDDDCEAAPDWLDTIAGALDEQPDVGIFAGALVASSGSRWRISVCPSATPRDFTLRPDPDHPTLPDGSDAVTANLAVRRWAFDRVGRFDELLGPGAVFRSGEDLDFMLRAVREGIPIRFLPTSVVHHSSGRRFGLRAVLRTATAYGYGQGAVAAKMTYGSRPESASWNGRIWRRNLWRASLVQPLRALRPHRAVAALPRLTAFERAYRSCLRSYSVDTRGHLARDPV